MNEYNFDLNLMMYVIKDKIESLNLSLRSAAKEIGISASTLTRIAKGSIDSMPDFNTISAIARWAEMNVSDFDIGNRNPVILKIYFPEVEQNLRRLAGLDEKSKNVLVNIVKAVYKSLKKG